MRRLTEADRLARFMRALGRAAVGDTRVYLTGGATAVHGLSRRRWPGGLRMSGAGDRT